jgi:hypothetical protein
LFLEREFDEICIPSFGIFLFIFNLFNSLKMIPGYSVNQDSLYFKESYFHSLSHQWWTAPLTFGNHLSLHRSNSLTSS